MSHGGLMGTSESVYCQMPTIVTPIYGDQYLNAAALNYRGMGIILHYNQLTEQNIFNSIQQILQSRFVPTIFCLINLIMITTRISFNCIYV